MVNIVEVVVRTINDTKAGLDSAKSDFSKAGKDIADSLKPVGIAMAGSGLLSMAAPLGAAGLAVGAFGALAAPTLSKVEKALTSTGAAGKKAWADLDPSQQGLATSIKGLESSFDAVAKSLEPMITGVLNLGVTLAHDLLPSLSVLGSAGGAALKSILTPLDQLVKSSGFTTFISQMASFAKQAAPVIGTLLVGALQVLMQLMQQLAPIGLQLLSNFTPLFLDVMKSAGPVVVTLAGALNGILGFLKPMNSLVGPLVVSVYALAKGFTLVSGVAKGLSAVMKIFDVELAANPIGLVVVAIAALATGFYIAWQKSALFRDIIKDIGTVMLSVGIVVVQANKAIVGAFLDMVGAVIHGAADAFGWVPGLGSKLKGAATAFDGFKTNVSNDFDGIISKMKSWQGEMSGATSTANDMTTKILADFSNQSKYADSAKTAIGTLSTAITENGTKSQAAQSARASLINDMIKAGVNADIAKADVTSYSTAIAANGTKSQAAQAARAKLISDILAASSNARQGKTDLTNYTTAIQNNGTKSDAAKSARAKLILDLENAGVNAKTANQLVNNLSTAISKLPSKTVAIHMNGQGLYTITGSVIAASQGKGGSGNAAGGLAAGGMISGGTPGKDSVVAALMPGEVVVPTAMVNAGAVDHLRGRLPGFASGGVVGGNLNPGYVTGMYGTFQDKMTNSMVAAMRASMKSAEAAAVAAAKAAAAAANAAGSPGPGGGAPSANAALARKLYPAWGSGAEWNAWNALEMQEAGWNQFARNPSSGAYGIPQALPPGKMGAAANPPQSNPTAQINWMVGYIKSTYGDPIRAEQHELANHWYDGGGWLPTGKSIAVNNTGAPEMVVGPQGLKIQLEFANGGGMSELDEALMQWLRNKVRIKGGGDVQKAFGRN